MESRNYNEQNENRQIYLSGRVSAKQVPEIQHQIEIAALYIKMTDICLKRALQDYRTGPAEGSDLCCRVQTEENPYFSIARNAAGSTSGIWISSLFSASSP